MLIFYIFFNIYSSKFFLIRIYNFIKKSFYLNLFFNIDNKIISNNIFIIIKIVWILMPLLV